MFILWPLLYIIFFSTYLHHLLWQHPWYYLRQYTGPHHATSLLKCVIVTLFYYSTECDNELSLIGSKMCLQLKRIHYPMKEMTANTRQIFILLNWWPYRCWPNTSGQRHSYGPTHQAFVGAVGRQFQDHNSLWSSKMSTQYSDWQCMHGSESVKNVLSLTA